MPDEPVKKKDELRRLLLNVDSQAQRLEDARSDRDEMLRQFGRLQVFALMQLDLLGAFTWRKAEKA